MELWSASNMPSRVVMGYLFLVVMLLTSSRKSD